ncbi:tyrosine-type recombinase/integrase [Thalassobellus suaedae]|uniref:Tyrosine-type recombinase/integrase n=1 Tax=Thalassobellus suaedae TaxID=3074124 RepID=A0ABY9XVV4_9FLAO|nr:tyrosine-type recombinase/integrase [Flavobacteriaceae bacterium HL-DH14]
MDIRKWIQKYDVDCDVKYSSLNTRKTYKNGVREFLEYFSYEVEPKSISNHKIKVWLLQSKTLNTRKHRQCSVNSFYKLTVRMPSKISKIPYPKNQRKLPRVIETDYLLKTINNISNIKHKALIATGFDLSLRRDEVINIKMCNIDRKRMLVLIENGKGKKDRYVKLSDELLLIWDAYYSTYKPITYLFNGESKTSLKYSPGSYNLVVKKYLGNQYSTHTLRHSGATSMLENGTPLPIIQELLGHESIKTTKIYTHVSLNTLQNVKSPLSK